MRMIKVVLSFILILVLTSLYAQNKPQGVSLSSDISRPDTITSLTINFSDEANQYSLLDKFTNIKCLWLQEMQDIDVDKIKAVKCPVSLTISDSPELDLNKLFDKGIKCENITKLTLQGDQLNKLPAEILKLKSLKKLVVKDNDGFDITSFFNYCKELPALTSINISENRISSLPSQVSVLNNIRVLNIKENLLEKTGMLLNSFPNADSLMLEGNMFGSIVDDLLKYKNNKIKFISLDSSVALDPKWEAVKAQFPQTTFKLIPDFNTINNKDSANTVLPDSLSLSLKKPESKASDDSITVGSFKLENNSFRILSDAYLHYPKLFPTPNITYDSLFFEERFLDLDYVNNVRKTRSFLKGRIRLGMWKRDGHNIVFFINTEGTYASTMYNELSVYNGNRTTKWVYKNNDYKRRKFKKLFVGRRRKPVYWNDIKIEYNAVNNEYVLKLKNDTTFFSFNCYIQKPELNYSSKDKRVSEVSYLPEEKAELKRYLRYVKIRSSRENKVNKSVLKNKDLYQKAMMKYYNTNWQNFQQMFMSVEEKKMTRAQWMEYYEKVIADEPAAIRNCGASVDATKRALDIDGYKYSYTALLVGDSIPIEQCSLQFRSIDNKIIAVKKVLIIIPGKQKYLTAAGSLNSDFITTILPFNEKVMFVVETINGNIGIATSEEVEKDRQDKSRRYTIKMKMLDKKIATVGQVYNILSW